LIYGWLFFGVVIGCLFWIGGRWREDDLPVAVTPAAARANLTAGSVSQFWLAAGVVLVATAVWKIGYFAVEGSQLASRPHLELPRALGDWTPAEALTTTWTPRFINPATELHSAFSNGNNRVGLIVTYYRNQDHNSKLVSSENRLVNSDDPAWLSVRSGTRNAKLGGQSVPIRTTELRGTGGQELLVWQWYWINGRVTANEYWARAHTLVSRLQYGGDDSAAVVIYARKDRDGDAERTLEAFVNNAGPALEALLLQTRNTR
jgi:EpsI family protein